MRALRPRVLLGLVILTIVLTPVLNGQSQVRDQPAQGAIGTGIVTGVVTTAGVSPVPVRRVVMGLSGGSLRTSLLAVTDAEGRFEFKNLPPGRFTLDARKAGFVREVYGAATIGATEGVQIPVSNDATTTVAMSLVRSAAISGQVVMPPGAPVSSVLLQVLRWDTARGRRRLVSARGGAFSLGSEGRYRIGSLPPGEYVIVGYPRGRTERRLYDPEGPGAIVDLAPVYSPGTLDPTQAAAVRIEAGEDRVVDIPMQFVQTGRVEGRVIGVDSAPMPGAQVSFSPNLPALPQQQPVRTSADGTFVLPSLVPGSYTILARGAPAGMPQPTGGGPMASQPRLPLWASTSLIVAPGDRIQGIDLHLQPGRAVRGRLVLPPGSGTPVNPSAVFVSLVADDDSSPVLGLPFVQPAADRTFEVSGVAPGRYRLQVTVPDVLRNEVFVVGIEADGRDALDTAVTVVSDRDVDVSISLSTNPSVVDISARDADGLPQAGLALVVFPRDPALRLVPSRRVVFTRTGADGIASVRGLPDGTYLVSALSEIPETLAQTPEWFEALAAAATPTDVRDGQPSSVGLKITR